MVASNHLRAILDRIAATENVDPQFVSLGDRGVVFYHSGDQLLCLCQKGSQFWNEAEAEVIAALAIRNASRFY